MKHLLHIGYAKTGSTFLQRWFAAHPQIAYAEGGIAGFGDVWQIARDSAAPPDGKRWRVTSCEGIATPVLHAHLADPETAKGGRQPIHANAARACDTLAGLFPNATILVMTRGFRSMMVSSYSQYVRAGGTQTLPGMIADATAVRPWHYDQLIDLYRSRFGRDRVMILPFEALRDDPGEFCRSLEDRMSLDHANCLPPRVNESLSGNELAWYPRLAALTRRLPATLEKRRRQAAFTNQLRLPIKMLQAVRPLPPVTAALITDEALRPLRGQAELLRALPEYAPYAAEYLL